MKIISQRALRGANFYHIKPGILMQISEAGSLEELKKLTQLILEIQNEAQAFAARPISQVVDAEQGIIFYSYDNEKLGLRAGKVAVRILEEDMIDYQDEVQKLEEFLSKHERSLDLQSLIEFAEQANIPWYKLKNQIQIGQGRYSYLATSKQFELEDLVARVEDGLIRRIPTITVTGTNGKTTTARIITHILQEAGYQVGLTSTDGIYMNGEQVKQGDYSGPGGAREVFLNPKVEIAVLEVARGGILRRGLGYDRSDVAVLTNVSSDHLGQGGIDNLTDLARVKGTIVTAVDLNGYAVLNGDDDLVMSMQDLNPGHQIIYAMSEDNPAIKSNQDSSGYNIFQRDGAIWVEHQGALLKIDDLKKIPITYDGMASFNVYNVMASIGALIAIGIGIEDIQRGLRSLVADFESTPGRMNLMDVNGIKVVIDYGHNPGSVIATGEFLKNLVSGRKIRLTSAAGDRQDEDIVELGYQVARIFDTVILADPTPRNRPNGETLDLLRRGILKGGVDESEIFEEIDEERAIEFGLKLAQPGDLLVLQVEFIEDAYNQVMNFKE